MDETFSEVDGRDLHALERLHHWLTLEGATALAIPAMFFLPIDIGTLLLKWAAIAFTPYMLWRLYQVRRFGWIATFIIAVAAPLALMRTPETITYAYLLSLLPLLLFYSYTWILRQSVGVWLEEARWAGRH